MKIQKFLNNCSSGNCGNVTLPLKYKTVIGNAGIEFSAGQKQRILIVRAICKKFSNYNF